MGAQPIDSRHLSSYPFCPVIDHSRAEHSQAETGYGRLLQDMLNNGFLNQPWKEELIGRRLLAALARRGHIDHVKMVLKEYERHDIEHQLLDLGYATFVAVEARREMILPLLLDHGDDIVEADRTRNYKPSATVNCRGSQSIVRTHLRGRTALHNAAFFGNPRIATTTRPRGLR